MSELFDIHDEGLNHIGVKSRAAAEAAAVGSGPEEIMARRNDFIPSIDNYSFKALALANRYFAGERRLWI